MNDTSLSARLSVANYATLGVFLYVGVVGVGVVATDLMTLSAVSATTVQITVQIIVSLLVVRFLVMRLLTVTPMFTSVLSREILSGEVLFRETFMLMFVAVSTITLATLRQRDTVLHRLCIRGYWGLCIRGYWGNGDCVKVLCTSPYYHNDFAGDFAGISGGNRG